MDVFTNTEDRSKKFKCFTQKTLNWLYGIFCILLIAFLITILVLVIIEFTRENNMQSQLQPNTLLNTLRKGLNNYMGNDIILHNRQSFCFSKKYKLNPDTKLQITDTLNNYLKKKIIEINDPGEYIFNNQNKVYLNKGRIDIYYDNDQPQINYIISSNLPYFSTIKLVHISIDPLDQTFTIKHKYNLCTNEVKDDRQCKTIAHDRIMHHYNNTINEIIIDNNNEDYTIYVVVFFMNQNDLPSHYGIKKQQQQQQTQHKNLLGDIAFVLGLDKC